MASIAGSSRELVRSVLVELLSAGSLSHGPAGAAAAVAAALGPAARQSSFLTASISGSYFSKKMLAGISSEMIPARLHPELMAGSVVLGYLKSRFVAGRCSVDVVPPNLAEKISSALSSFSFSGSSGHAKHLGIGLGAALVFMTGHQDSAGKTSDANGQSGRRQEKEPKEPKDEKEFLDFIWKKACVMDLKIDQLKMEKKWNVIILEGFLGEKWTTKFMNAVTIWSDVYGFSTKWIVLYVGALPWMSLKLTPGEGRLLFGHWLKMQKNEADELLEKLKEEKRKEEEKLKQEKLEQEELNEEKPKQESSSNEATGAVKEGDTDSTAKGGATGASGAGGATPQGGVTRAAGGTTGASS